MKSLSCPNGQCSLPGKAASGQIIRHGFYKTTCGKRRRYRCQTCGKTFCSTTRTPYHRLQHRRAIFDEVAAFSVEGLNKSAIARAKRIAWKQFIAGWREQPSGVAGSTIEKYRGSLQRNSRQMRSERSLGPRSSRSGFSW